MEVACSGATKEGSKEFNSLSSFSELVMLTDVSIKSAKFSHKINDKRQVKFFFEVNLLKT
jgi:hypothetical protein